MSLIECQDCGCIWETNSVSGIIGDGEISAQLMCCPMCRNPPEDVKDLIAELLPSEEVNSP